MPTAPAGGVERLTRVSQSQATRLVARLSVAALVIVGTACGDSLVVVLPATGALGIVDLQQSPPQTTVIPIELLDPATKQRPAQVRVLSDGKAFVTLEGLGESAFQRYDIATDHFGPGRSPKTSGLPVLDATGQHVVVGFDIYDESRQYLRGVDSPVLPATVPTVLSPYGEILYQLLSGTGLLRSSVTEGTIVDRAHNPIEGLRLWISDDG